MFLLHRPPSSRHCEARSAEAIQESRDGRRSARLVTRLVTRLLDCFAALAMTMGVAAVIAALAACQPPPVHQLAEYAVTPDYERATLERDLAGRTVRVVVFGNPFAVPADAFAGQLAAAMTDAHAIDARFLARGDPEGGAPVPGYTVVWDFAPAGALSPDAICAERAAPPGARAPLPIDAYVALCRGDKALSAVRARLYYTETQNSLEFIGLVDDATRALFPAHPPAFRRPGDTTIAPQVPHVAR